MKDQIIYEMIKDVDSSELLTPNSVKNYRGRVMAPTGLSGGVKALIMLYNVEKDLLVNGDSMGENCYKWVIELGKIKDIYLTMTDIMDFVEPHEEYLPFECRILNTGFVTKTFDDYFSELYSILGRYGWRWWDSDFGRSLGGVRRH
jgi:hypothetical protein